MARRRRGGLSEDDLELWRKVAQSTTPLSPNIERPTIPPSLSGPEADPRAPKSQTPPAFRIGARANGTANAHDLSLPIERSLAAAPLRMDKNVFTRMKRGKLRPERKLDLHGMTLAQAHPALNGFIRSAHADGCRLVIVVTGKGKSGKDEGGPIPTPRGVLRHQVPQWLHAPPLRPLVLQVTDAHLRHGGSGAYYVYLTRGPGGGARPG
ncbi:MAG: Smr/MutS family protein [Pseudomonadota bacterium]